ncbi:MAG: hypothetical protein M1825_004166 [Sarcosagium campestre]|nr:MAG: hypothetical protein M1825_004166 [Sarcosagium campestre]
MSAPTVMGHPNAHGHRRRFSTSNSLSSSSIDTVIPRGPSPNSSSGSRPRDGGRFAETVPSTDSRKMAAPMDGHANGNPAATNRWSQSTSSSISSSGHKRRSSFTKRLSLAGSGALGLNRSQSPPRNFLDKTRPWTSGNSQQRASPPVQPFVPSIPSSDKSTPSQLESPNYLNGGPPPSFGLPPSTVPPISTLPSLRQAISAAGDSPSSAAVTPSTAAMFTPSQRFLPKSDYFGEQSAGHSPTKQRPASPVVSQAEYDNSARQAPRLDQPARPLAPPDGAQRSHADASVTRGRENANRRSRRRSDHGHSRNRDGDSRGKGSGSTQNSATSAKSTSQRDSRDKHPSQKAMLSKALQKANTAVLLDNAQNFEGAVDAYADACALLQQVMKKSSGDEDRRKLETIRNTYSNRVIELRSMPMQETAPGKALPARPVSDATSHGRDSTQSAQSYMSNGEQSAAIIEVATVANMATESGYSTEPRGHRSLAPIQIPQRRQSLLPSALEAVEDALKQSPSSPAKLGWSDTSFTKAPPKERLVETSVSLQIPMDRQYMPPPLSPRRPISPASPESANRDRNASPIPHVPQVPQIPALARAPSPKARSRAGSTESTSWLDTIDESAGSSGSSVHSRSSFAGLRRRHIRAASGETEAEFDAALDAAVEAAYDDGLEPAEEDAPQKPVVLSHARKNVELAKERVREAEREAAIIFAKGRAKGRFRDAAYHNRSESLDLDYHESEAEEEERMLEEMTRGYVMDDFEFDLQSKSALPRQSDSSGFSGRTWGSSIGSNPSNPTTAGTSLQTLAEAPILPSVPMDLHTKPPPPKHPPPSSALPPPPQHSVVSSLPGWQNGGLPNTPTFLDPNSQSVRNRRLSGQNPKQLKIETSNATSPVRQGPFTAAPAPADPISSNGEDAPSPPRSARPISPVRRLGMGRQPPLIPPPPALTNRQVSSPLPDNSPADSTISPATPGLVKSSSVEGDMGAPPLPQPGESPVQLSRASPGPGVLRKNYSSSSLKNRNLHVLSPEGSEASPSTPMSTTFAAAVSNLRKGYPLSVPTLPTPTATGFAIGHMPPGGLNLFDSDIHAPTTPGSPNPLAANAPVALEPCPSECIRRPFWLMRCFYQTIAHPRGGYISTKLFVPRDVWLVKGVKLKAIDEKIANCDFLTAALMKLAKVDTCDADAVLEEMQHLETVLDQVQANLSKKLGSDVGMQSSAALFKDAGPAGGESGANGAEPTASKASSTSGKSSYLSSWKRLRSKNSGAGLTGIGNASGSNSNSYNGNGHGNNIASSPSKDGTAAKDTISMSTLPMSSTPWARTPKRQVRQVEFAGPNASYMGSLARLFDAAQVLDQIARQAEDPGLRHSSPTHVGLELSTRHAAEFFGFFVCRFALTDISMMLDKFIKRGSEWVLV